MDGDGLARVIPLSREHKSMALGLAFSVPEKVASESTGCGRGHVGYGRVFTARQCFY